MYCCYARGATVWVELHLFSRLASFPPVDPVINSHRFNNMPMWPSHQIRPLSNGEISKLERKLGKDIRFSSIVHIKVFTAEHLFWHVWQDPHIWLLVLIWLESDENPSLKLWVKAKHGKNLQTQLCVVKFKTCGFSWGMEKLPMSSWYYWNSIYTQWLGSFPQNSLKPTGYLIAWLLACVDCTVCKCKWDWILCFNFYCQRILRAMQALL